MFELTGKTAVVTGGSRASAGYLPEAGRPGGEHRPELRRKRRSRRGDPGRL